MFKNFIGESTIELINLQIFGWGFLVWSNKLHFV